MVFEFLGNLDTTTAFLLLIVFILFIISLKKFMGIIRNGLIILIASALFPIVANKLLGLPVPADTGSIISFAMTGLFIYFLYLVGTTVYKVLSIAERVAKPFVPKSKTVGKGEKENGKEEDGEDKTSVVKTPVIPVIQKARKKKDWTKEFMVLDEKEEIKQAATKEKAQVKKKPEKKTQQKKKTKSEKKKTAKKKIKPAKKVKRKKREKAVIEEIPMIGEE